MTVARRSLDAGSDIEMRRDYTPLQLACKSGQFEIALFFISEGADTQAPGRDDKTILHLACQSDSVELVCFLLENGWDTIARDIDGNMPLHFACRKRRDGVINRLLDYGADVMHKDTDGMTPLYCYCSLNDTSDPENSLIEAMLNLGANIHCPDNYGNTPLHYIRSPTILKFLIQQRAQVDARNQRNCTALHMACLYATPEAVEILIKAGANIHIPNTYGSTPLDIACITGRRDIYLMLLPIPLGPDMPLPTILDFDNPRSGRTDAIWQSMIYHLVRKRFMTMNPGAISNKTLGILLGLDNEDRESPPTPKKQDKVSYFCCFSHRGWLRRRRGLLDEVHIPHSIDSNGCYNICLQTRCTTSNSMGTGCRNEQEIKGMISTGLGQRRSAFVRVLEQYT